MGNCQCKNASETLTKGEISNQVKINNNDKILQSQPDQNYKGAFLDETKTKNAALVIQSRYRGFSAKKQSQEERMVMEKDKPKSDFAVEYEEVRLNFKLELNQQSFLVPLLPQWTIDRTLNNNYWKLQPHKILQTGDIYNGQWFEGFPQGFGQMIRNDGAIIEAIWNKGQSVNGGILYGNGDSYEGEMNDIGEAQGQGTYKFSRGIIIQSQFCNCLPHGQAKIFYPDGSVYEGFVKQGKKNGRGQFTYIDQAIYSGEFNEDIITGQGEFCWPNGTKYVGEWLNNRMHGKGLFYFADGRTYTGKFVSKNILGDFLNDKQEGQGELVQKDKKTIYRGEFLNGKKHGIGQILDLQGIILANQEWNQGQLLKNN